MPSQGSPRWKSVCSAPQERTRDTFTSAWRSSLERAASSGEPSRVDESSGRPVQRDGSFGIASSSLPKLARTVLLRQGPAHRPIVVLGVNRFIGPERPPGRYWTRQVRTMSYEEE